MFQNNILFTLLLFVYYLFLELHLCFHYSYQGCDNARETTCPMGGFPKNFPSCGAAVSCMNPRLWRSAPTLENSLQWHRDG